MNIRRIPVFEIVLVVLSAGCLAFFGILDYRRQQAAMPTVDTYSTYDYHGGGYRAYYELLKREGLRIERFDRRPAYLDESIDTLIVASSMAEIVQKLQSSSPVGLFRDVDRAALRDWVKRGGTLVWITDGSGAGRELKFPALQERGPTRDSAVTIALSPLVAGVSGVSGKGRQRVPFDFAEAAPLIADDTGAVLTEQRLGSGRVVVATDPTLFDNAHLAKADNARLAYNLGAFGRTSRGAVAFDEWVHGFIGGETWWSILPRQFRWALMIVGAALVLLGVGTVFRFGPTAQLPAETERTGAEYLTSVARLLARGRAARKALRDLVDNCLRGVAGAIGLPESAAAVDIAARLQRSPDGEQWAARVIELDRMRSYQQPSPAELVHAAQLCTTLRKEYTRYGGVGFGRRSTPPRWAA